MNYLESLNWRYATKRMNGKNIPSDKLDNILEAIRLAPTSLGLQPFHVFVIKDKSIRERIQKVSYGQPQIVEASDLLVFAVNKNIKESYVDRYIQNTANTRGQTVDELAPFKEMIDGFIQGYREDTFNWASRQAYIALGFGLMAAAIESVDATPMEGYSPRDVDQILNLEEKELRSVCMLALGYRDEENDSYAKKAKVRQSRDELFTFVG